MAGAAVAILQSWEDKSKTKTNTLRTVEWKDAEAGFYMTFHYKNNPATAQLLEFLLCKIVNNLYYSSHI